MGRRKDPKTASIYCYVLPEHKDYVKKMRSYFRSESNYIDALIKKDMEHETLKNNLIKKMKKQTEKALDLLEGSKAHTLDPISSGSVKE